MIQVSQIREHMDLVGSDGGRVGLAHQALRTRGALAERQAACQPPG